MDNKKVNNRMKVYNLLIENYWENSFIRSIFIFFSSRIKKITDSLISFLLKNSIIIRLLDLISDKLILIYGIFFASIFILPDNLWSNLYLYLGVAFLFLLDLLKNRNRTCRIIFDEFLVLFIVSLILSAVFSVFPRLSFKYLINYIVIFMGYYLFIKNIESEKDFTTFINCLVVAVVLVGVYGIIQDKIIGVPVNTSQTDISISQNLSGRIFSTLGNPNVLGEFYLLTLPFVVGLFLYHRELWKKAIFAVIILISTYILLKTGSRSAWGALAVGAAIFVLLWQPKLFPLFFLAGLIMFFFLPDSISSRILSILNRNDTSVKTRGLIAGWSAIMKKDYQLLGGAGLGVDVFQTIFSNYNTKAGLKIAHSHNLYTQIILESGIFALIFLLGFLFKNIILSLMVESEKNSFNYYMRLSAIFALVSAMVMGLADHVWFFSRILFLFWLVVAVLVLTIRNEKIKNEI